MSNNDYYLHRPGFNPSSRATYTIFHPSTNNFYTTMSVGRALLLNPDMSVVKVFMWNVLNVSIKFSTANNFFVQCRSPEELFLYSLVCVQM